MTIAVNPFRPHLRSVLPDLHMVIKTHSEMVGNEIFSGHSQVKWIPIFKFLARQHRTKIERKEGCHGRKRRKGKGGSQGRKPRKEAKEGGKREEVNKI